MKSNGGYSAILTVSLALLAGGCQSSSTLPPPRQQQSGVTRLPIAGQQQTDVPANSTSVDQAVLSDPSAVKLDSIIEGILLFFQQNKGMPGKLDDLRSIAGEEQLDITAPSGQVYVYYPQGLTSPGTSKLLVVCDPQESPNGRRWCILVSQLNPGAPLTGEVLAIPEIVYRSYLASNP